MNNDLEALLIGLEKLPKHEMEYILFGLLRKGKIDFVELSKLYVRSLEKDREYQGKVLTKASNWLSLYWKSKKPNLLDAGTAYWLLKHAGMKQAPIGKKLENYLKNNPYTEDDDFMPKTELHL